MRAAWDRLPSLVQAVVPAAAGSSIALLLIVWDNGGWEADIWTIPAAGFVGGSLGAIEQEWRKRRRQRRSKSAEIRA